MTRFQLKSQKRDNSLEYKIISNSSETSDDDVIENLICNEEKEIKKISSSSSIETPVQMIYS